MKPIEFQQDLKSCIRNLSATWNLLKLKWHSKSTLAIKTKRNRVWIKDECTNNLAI